MSKLIFLCCASPNPPKFLLKQKFRRVQILTQATKKEGAKDLLLSWLELRYGNITFADELDFDPAELDIVYEDNDTEVSQ